MRKKVIAGNWKMNMLPNEAIAFFEQLEPMVKNADSEIVVCVPFIDLFYSLMSAQGTNIKIGAQNMHWEEEGQFSGEVSPLMLTDLNVSLVMLGHSERRHVFYEADGEIRRKVLSAIGHGIRPLLCIGETQKEKDAGISDERLRIQLKTDLLGFPKEALDQLLVAYEPVWAIGTSGVPAPASYVQERHSAIRQCLVELFGTKGASVPLLFGGSVNPQNAPGYLELPDVNGLFVGRSAWDADHYYQMVRDLFLK